MIETFQRSRCKNQARNIDITFEIDSSIDILKKNYSKKLYSSRRISIREIDNFLLSGRFNSVLGLDGFTIYKKVLKDVISKINSNDFSTNIINLDKMFEALIDSGLYYEDEYLPEGFKNLKEDNRWLTAYRYIAKNFPNINYKDFREIVKRYEDTRGYSFYISQDDSNSLKSLLNKQELFIEVVDLKAELMQLNQNELRNICIELDIKPARSMLETADRLLEVNEDVVRGLLPKKTKSRTNLIIKDDELATGTDIINLDKYLRELSKVIRAELSDYILERRHIPFLRG